MLKERNNNDQQEQEESELGPTLQQYVCPYCHVENSVPYQAIDGIMVFAYYVRCSECLRAITKEFFTWLGMQGCKYSRMKPAGKPDTETIEGDEPLVSFEEAIERLENKQKLFVIEYLKDFNGTQAAIRAGYSEHSARVIATENLLKPAICYAMKCFFQPEIKKTRKTVDDVISRLEAISFTDLSEIIRWTPDGLTFPVNSEDLTPAQKAAIEAIRFNENANGISVEVKMADRLGALKLLGQHLGMWQKTLKIEGNITHETYEQKRKRLGLDRTHPKEILRKYLEDHKETIEMSEVNQEEEVENCVDE